MPRKLINSNNSIKFKYLKYSIILIKYTQKNKNLE